MQNLVRDLMPYIQRFIYHHDELGEIYEDLKESGIAKEIKSLSFGQVSMHLSCLLLPRFDICHSWLGCSAC